MKSVPPVKIEPESADARARCGPEAMQDEAVGRAIMMREKEMRETRRCKWEAEKKRQKRTGVATCAEWPKVDEEDEGG
ncbi:hypothetical protein CORC01_08070 [Colletotrichum orchidophilum]|uniref:Uncharacterized protein n=1 Tax=Colletotrichum orchidophilum TaxID=1209926 RepID=A0A1G4B5M6_9PEZI|nr:uncharacterized protein CORC01_08070 [Colletotrichum orchidophilum]OHE96613.1 hypothetical protein CORC01_08070 [Colletotrichum orchidophilum]